MGKSVSKPDTVTPMMAQYLDIKAGYPDALLFYRMGDFYEMFFDDAVAASEALDIALTKRGKHLGSDIPMCGVPVHSAEGYFLTLIRKGFRVAVCEQLEDPAEAKKRGSKAVVKRDVVRLVTPGTLTEDSLLDARRHNFLASYTMVRDTGALAWVDISTGALSVVACPGASLGPELARLAPREVLLSEASEPIYADAVTESGASLTGLGNAAFDSAGAEKRLVRSSAWGRWMPSAASAEPRFRRWARWSNTWKSPRRESCRCFARRCWNGARRRCRSTRRRGGHWS